jgi:NTE family protein
MEVGVMPYGEDHFRVALACQGGGSHTAFTAGVLKVLLADRRVDIRALSGTSGGAVCAALAWYGLYREDPYSGIERLDAFWQDIMTHGILEELAYEAWLQGVRIVGEAFAPEVSPYLNPFEPSRTLRRVLERHIPFAELSPPLDADRPRLLISAADVESGEFRVFRSHRIGDIEADRLSAGVIMASAAVPTLFRAVHLCDRIYWDGLFSQNPPVRELPDAARGEDEHGNPGPAPDELWIIQINPDARHGEPTSMADIRDRRNELAANISFQQEVFFIGRINRLIHDKLLSPKGMERYQPIKIRAITMAAEEADKLSYESKLRRDPRFIGALMRHGERRARRFLRLLGSANADSVTACWQRDIWGNWIGPAAPCLDDP